MHFKYKTKSTKACESICRAVKPYGLTLEGEGKEGRAISWWQRRLFQFSLSSHRAGEKNMQSGHVLPQTLHVNVSAQFSKETFHKNLTNIPLLGWLMMWNPDLGRENQCTKQQSWDCYLRNTLAFSFMTELFTAEELIFLYFSVKQIIFNHLLSHSLKYSRSSLCRVVNSILSCKGAEHPLTTVSTVQTMLENVLCFTRIEMWLNTWLL